MLLPIVLKGKTREILKRANVQVYSLESIEPQIRNLFLLGKRKVLVIFDKDSLKGRLHAAGSDQISVETDDEVPAYVKKGSTALVVLPLSREKRYVMQGKVKNRFLHMVEIVPSDPRADKRLNILKKHFVANTFEIPDTLVQGLLYDKLIVLREINFGIDNLLESVEESSLKGSLATSDHEGLGTSSPAQFRYKAKDFFVEPHSREVHPKYRAILQRKPLTQSEIMDISRGGMALVFPEDAKPVDIGEVLAISGDLTLSPTNTLEFLLLGLVRGTSRGEKNTLCVHIMYLKALPKRAQELFERSFGT